jgi:hypothetical protein
MFPSHPFCLQENQQLRSDLSANERQLDRLQGYGLDALSSSELTELVHSLTAAVERVRITTQLRHVQYLSTSRHLTGTSASTDSDDAVEPSFRSTAGSGRSRLVSGAGTLNRPGHRTSVGSKGLLYSARVSQIDYDTQMRNGLSPPANGTGGLLSSSQSKRSMDMDRQDFADHELE